jgi:hypothetical protein
VIAPGATPLGPLAAGYSFGVGNAPLVMPSPSLYGTLGYPGLGVAYPYGYAGYGPYPYAGFYPYTAPYGSWNGNAMFPNGGGFYGNNLIAYGQQLYQLQALQTQQIYQQQQQSLLYQLATAEQRLPQLEAAKADALAQFARSSEQERMRLRVTLAYDYLNLSPDRQAAWQRDPLVQTIMGNDHWWQQLEAARQYRELDQEQRSQFRKKLLDKYRTLDPDRQAGWQRDPAIEIVMGRERWWE